MGSQSPNADMRKVNRSAMLRHRGQARPQYREVNYATAWV